MEQEESSLLVAVAAGGFRRAVERVGDARAVEVADGGRVEHVAVGREHGDDERRVEDREQDGAEHVQVSRDLARDDGRRVAQLVLGDKVRQWQQNQGRYEFESGPLGYKHQFRAP